MSRLGDSAEKKLIRQVKTVSWETQRVAMRCHDTQFPCFDSFCCFGGKCFHVSVVDRISLNFEIPIRTDGFEGGQFGSNILRVYEDDSVLSFMMRAC